MTQIEWAKLLVSNELLCCDCDQAKYAAIYQLETNNGKLTAIALEVCEIDVFSLSTSD